MPERGLAVPQLLVVALLCLLLALFPAAEAQSQNRATRPQDNGQQTNETTTTTAPAANQGSSGTDEQANGQEIDECVVMTDVLQELDFLSLTFRALQSAGILETMRSRTPFITLLAPTNQGFSNAARRLGLQSVAELLRRRAVVRRILEQHIIPAVLDTREDLVDGQVMMTLDFGNPLAIERSDTNQVIFVGTGNEATQLRVELSYEICNAAIIIIDDVLIPADVFLTNSFNNPVVSTSGLPDLGGGGLWTGVSTIPMRDMEVQQQGEGGENSRNNGGDVDEASQQGATNVGSGNGSQEVARSGSASTMIESADYDISDYYVDDAGEIPLEGVPMIGVRVPPLEQLP